MLFDKFLVNWFHVRLHKSWYFAFFLVIWDDFMSGPPFYFLVMYIQDRIPYMLSVLSQIKPYLEPHKTWKSLKELLPLDSCKGPEVKSFPQASRGQLVQCGQCIEPPSRARGRKGDPCADSNNLYWLEHAVEDALVSEWCHEQLSLIFATLGKGNQLSNLYLYLIVQVKLPKINWAQARQNFNTSARWLESGEYDTE